MTQRKETYGIHAKPMGADRAILPVAGAPRVYVRPQTNPILAAGFGGFHPCCLYLLGAEGKPAIRLPWLDQPADAAAGLGGLWVALCGFHLVPAYVGTWGDFGGAGRADMHGVAENQELVNLQFLTLL